MHQQTNSRARGTTPAAPLLAVASLQPALADIPSAIDYLGRPSRSKFYADLLPHLDVVRFGSRTFVTVESLDRLIAAHRRRGAGFDAA
jgi:hypothetical protein